MYEQINTLVYDYPTKHERGFIWSEQQDLLKQFPNINMDKYYDAMKGNTCQMSTDGIISYHCDIVTALLCGIENRDITFDEWD